jgi:hypothetical protein
VTQKVAKGVAEIYEAKKKGEPFEPIELGNLNSKRDWSHAEDFMDGVWKMLNQENPQDYVLASGETHSIRELVTEAFNTVRIFGVWEKSQFECELKEVYKDNDGNILVKINPEFYRPAEVELLLGDPSKAQKELGWHKKKDGLKIFDAHIPKTGSSSISRYLRDHCGFKKICNLWHTPAKQSQATIEKEKPDHLFAVIRDPIDRIISEYNWAGGDWWDRPSKAFLYKEFCQNAEVNFFIYKVLSFFPDIGNERNGGPIDHLTPQVEYLHKDMKLFLFSDWKSISDYLFTLTGVQFNARINRSKPRASIKDLKPYCINKIVRFYLKDYHLINEINKKISGSGEASYYTVSDPEEFLAPRNVDFESTLKEVSDRIHLQHLSAEENQ